MAMYHLRSISDDHPAQSASTAKGAISPLLNSRREANHCLEASRLIGKSRYITRPYVLPSPMRSQRWFSRFSLAILARKALPSRSSQCADTYSATGK